MERVHEWLNAALGIGLESKDIGVLQMSLRAIGSTAWPRPRAALHHFAALPP